MNGVKYAVFSNLPLLNNPQYDSWTVVGVKRIPWDDFHMEQANRFAGKTEPFSATVTPAFNIILPDLMLL